MILKNSKEIPFDLNITSGLVAFIGDVRCCSNYAGRYQKTNSNVSTCNELKVNTRLDNVSSAPINLYYAGEFYDNGASLNLKPNTTLVVIVDDYTTRAEQTASYLSTFELSSINIMASDSEGITDEQRLLESTQWLIIRELERMLLKDSPLHQEREALRIAVDEAIKPTNREVVEVAEQCDPYKCIENKNEVQGVITRH